MWATLKHWVVGLNDRDLGAANVVSASASAPYVANYAMQVLRAVVRWHGVVIPHSPLGKDTAERDRIVLAPGRGDPSPIPPERLGAWWNAAGRASSRIAGNHYRFQLLPVVAE